MVADEGRLRTLKGAGGRVLGAAQIRAVQHPRPLAPPREGPAAGVARLAPRRPVRAPWIKHAIASLAERGNLRPGRELNRSGRPGRVRQGRRMR